MSGDLTTAERIVYDALRDADPAGYSSTTEHMERAREVTERVVATERDRIRGGLYELLAEARRDACCDGTGECGDHRCVADAQRIHTLDDVLIVLDEESAPAVKPGDPEYVHAEIVDSDEARWVPPPDPDDLLARLDCGCDPDQGHTCQRRR